MKRYWLLLAILLVPGAVAHGAEHSGPGAYNEPPDQAAVSGRLALYVGFALSLGAVAILLLRPPRHDDALFKVGAAGAVLQVLALVQLSALEAQYLEVSLGEYVASFEGFLSVLRVALTLLLGQIFALAWRQSVPRAVLVRLGLALGVFLAWMQAALNHAGGRTTVAILSDWVHLVAAASWFGGLVAFLVIVWGMDKKERLNEAAGAFIQRFAGFALVAAAIVVTTGVANAIMALGLANLRDPTLLWNYPYGRSLILKTVGVAALLGFAAINRFLVHESRLKRLLGANTPSARPRAWQRKYLVGEVMAACVVMVAASFLVSSAPLPQAFDPLDYEVFTVDIAGERHEGVAMILPYPQAGEPRLMTFDLRDDRGLSVDWSNVSFSVREIDTDYNRSYAIEHEGGPVAGARDTFFPTPGRYLVEVTVLDGPDRWDRISFGLIV